ncbi:MAG TPA: ABC transporter substrate-binding protein [Chloroflexota bacterium]|nr:ABC transporter substrate-binding protein [Chloroflexota bacterium]
MPAPAAVPTVAAQPIKVATPGQSFGFLPLLVAIRQGFFREEGLDPVEVAGVGGDLEPAALQAGEVDYAGAGGTIGRAAVQGLPLKLVLFLYERPTWSLVSRPEITTGEQLRGKTIGVSRIGTSDNVAARLAAAHLGLQPDRDITLVAAGLQVFPSLLSGAVDSGIINTDTTATALAQGYNELVALSDVAIWPFSGFGVADTKLAQQRDQVRRYARAQVKGLQFMLDHTAEVVPMAAEQFGMDPEIARLAVESALRAVSRSSPGGVSSEGLTRFIDTELRPDLPPDVDIQPAQFVDLSVIEEAQHELGIHCTTGYQC